MQVFKSYKTANDREFRLAVQRVFEEVSDLRLPFGIIAKNWRKGNNAQFSLKGTGKYPPLNPEYKRRKEILSGGASTNMLVGMKKGSVKNGVRVSGGGVSGRLRDSMVNEGSKDSILIITKSGLTMGTKVPYGVYHQSDEPRTKIPQRKFLFITDTQATVWINILNEEMKRKLK